MQFGYFSIEEVLEYIKDYPEEPIPSRKQDKPIYNGYKKIFRSLLKQVPKMPGWYIWLRMTDSDFHLIYIGKSGKGKTSNIWARLDEEFRDERIAFWATVHEHIRNREPTGRYAREAKRSLRRVGVTNIIWLGQKGLTHDQVKVVECMLIQKYDPPANIQKPKYVDKYPELKNNAFNICEKLIQEIKGD